MVGSNAAIRHLIGSILLPFASEICECAEGREAVIMYQHERPDVVLMDIRLNDVDGIQAAAQIKAVDPQARIVIVTDYDDDSLRQAAMHAGACEYVLKDNLLDLRRLLETMQQAESAEE